MCGIIYLNLGMSKHFSSSIKQVIEINAQAVCSIYTLIKRMNKIWIIFLKRYLREIIDGAIMAAPHLVKL